MLRYEMYLFYSFIYVRMNVYTSPIPVFLLYLCEGIFLLFLRECSTVLYKNNQ